MRQIEKERRQTLLRAHAAEQEHHVVIAIDLARKKSMKVTLQRRYMARELLQAIQRQGTDLAVLECDGLSLVIACLDPVEAQKISREVIAADLLTAVLCEHGSHGRSQPQGVQRGERVARTIQDLALFQPLAGGDQLIELIEVVLVETMGQAQL